MFTLFYFAYFFFLNIVSPGYVERVWNLKAISGVLVFGVPLEELMFAFTFGMLWSSYYQHITWLKIRARVPQDRTNAGKVEEAGP